MITSEEVRKVLETIGDVFTEEKEIAPYKSLKLNTYEEYKTLINYITQQEKKDKLLKLYKKYSKGLLSGKLCIQQLDDLRIEIKALEEELK